ncbi:MAG: F0F1 ATP synthase subunit A [Calditrichaeota bacterium]|nr:F0F1 ATP synthase subunit A [Calditrichota bacterium]RQW04903.1 MAG: F0F1 ATP synthase subunit A [Calditrichota bacterium]
MDISPDSIVYWQWGPITLNATIVFTWVIMLILIGISWMVTRNLSEDASLSRWQNFLEAVVSTIKGQIKDVVHSGAEEYLPFIGTLFLFISLSNFLIFVPGYHPPTGSIYTAGGLAICVFFAVPVYGIAKRGIWGYLKHYISPSPFMLPFNIIGEFSRTLSLAIRLFGNIMSGSLIVAILLSIVPLFVPVVMEILGLLIGQIQAYIFAVLAMVYIASATRSHEKQEAKTNNSDK